MTVPSTLDGPVIQDLDSLRLRTTFQLLSVSNVETANGRLESNVIMGTRRDVTLVVRSCLLMFVIQDSISTRLLTRELVLNAIDVMMEFLSQEKLVITQERTLMDVLILVLSIYSMIVIILQTLTLASLQFAINVGMGSRKGQKNVMITITTMMICVSLTVQKRIMLSVLRILIYFQHAIVMKLQDIMKKEESVL